MKIHQKLKIIQKATEKLNLKLLKKLAFLSLLLILGLIKKVTRE
jgi:hypothetical protein